MPETNDMQAGFTPIPQRTLQMRALVETKEWSATPLGHADRWSPSLRLALDMVLSSGFPMALRWGADFILLYNDGYARILGDKHPVALGLPAREAWAEVWDRIEPVHQAIMGGAGAIYSDDVALRIRRHHGEWEDAHFALGYSPVPDPKAPGGIGGVLVTAVETTTRIETERQLREAQAQLAALNSTLEQQVAARTHERDRLWRNSQDLLAVVSAEGVFQAVNPAWTGLLGWTPGDIEGRDHLTLVHPEDKKASQAALITALERPLPRFENRVRHKDGGHRWVSWLASAEDGLVYASGRDITAEKAAAESLAQTQEALRQSQKMEAIGQLTGGIAHDFNNMLAIVIGSLDLASRRIRRGDAGVEHYLENAAAGAARAATLTQRLLAFSRQSPLAPQALDLNSLAAGMSELLRSTLGEPIALETVLAGGLWTTYVDRNQLESALLNLAVNARDAMPDGGRLTLETANVHLDERYAARELGVEPGQYVLIAVSDVGQGMTPEVLERVFDPFFTTKSVGRGTGLGLSMVYGFARQSGGHVRIYSEPERGTTVKLYLPRHHGPVDPPKVDPAPRTLPTAASGEETVLIVEDEDRVREMSRAALLELGYRVFEASSGEEALDLYDRLDRVDILFTDVVMGGMTGRQLVDALRTKAPTLKVLYTTGYARNAVVHHGVLDPAVAYLPKPFSIEDLARKLRSILDSRAD